jgi:hypothetical protein
MSLLALAAVEAGKRLAARSPRAHLGVEARQR